LLDLASEDGFVEKSGSWFNYGKTRIGQGRDKARLFLEDNPEIMAELRRQVLTKRGFAHVIGEKVETTAAG
jgi:recombination protein RecA